MQAPECLLFFVALGVAVWLIGLGYSIGYCRGSKLKHREADQNNVLEQGRDKE